VSFGLAQGRQAGLAANHRASPPPWHSDPDFAECLDAGARASGNICPPQQIDIYLTNQLVIDLMGVASMQTVQVIDAPMMADVVEMHVERPSPGEPGRAFIDTETSIHG
jgi:hypothetical protein